MKICSLSRNQNRRFLSLFYAALDEPSKKSLAYLIVRAKSSNLRVPNSQAQQDAIRNGRIANPEIDVLKGRSSQVSQVEQDFVKARIIMK